MAEYKTAFVLYDYSKAGFKEENYRNYKEMFRFNGDKLEETGEHLECKTCWYYGNRITRDLDECTRSLD